MASVETNQPIKIVPDRRLQKNQIELRVDPKIADKILVQPLP